MAGTNVFKIPTVCLCILGLVALAGCGMDQAKDGGSTEETDQGNNGGYGNNGDYANNTANNAANNTANNAANNGWSGQEADAGYGNNGANNGWNNGANNGWNNGANNGGNNGGYDGANNGWEGPDAGVPVDGCGDGVCDDGENPTDCPADCSGGNTNINLGGAQDFGYFRRQLEDGIVPDPEDMDPAGFFAEHHTPLPQPECGERVCLQAMMGVMGNLLDGGNCTMLQLGLNSPIVANSQNRPPLTLAIAVDTSSSMSGRGKLDYVRDGLSLMVNELSDDDMIALVTYETSVRTPFAMAPVRGNRNRLQQIIGGLRPEGGTNLHGGLEAAYEAVFDEYDSGRQNRVILLSDGEPTEGVTDVESILAMSGGYNSEGVGLTTIGLGTSFNYQLMRSLAEEGDGNFYFVEDAAAVDEVFTEEISFFTVPVAFDLTVELAAGSDFRIARAYGSRFWEGSQTGGRVEIPSVFLAHRESHDDVTEGGGRRGGGSALLLELVPRHDEGQELENSHVATASLEFREPGSNRIVTEQAEIHVPFSPWNPPVRGYFDNGIVTKSFVMLNIYVALEAACFWFHEGESMEALAGLNRLIAAAEDYEDSANDGAGDVDIQYDIELMEQLIQVILDHGGQNPQDQEIPEDPWPAD